MKINPTDPKNIVIAALGAVVLSGGLYAFQPWKLFVNETVNDTLPISVSSQVPAPASPETVVSEAAGSEGAASTEQAQAPQNGPVILQSGQFIDHEHTTKGTASIIRTAEGKHQLIFENLDTSNGPDVHVWVSAGEVVEGLAGFKSAKEHEKIDLGVIKGNKGNQVYDLPADFDPSKWKSIDLWCDRFDVSFGAAPLNAI